MTDDARSAPLSRRDLLRLIGATSGGLILTGACGNEDGGEVEAAASSPSTLAVELRLHFSYLAIGEDVLEAFVRDFERHRGRFRLHAQAVPHARFLASTDFFQNGADEAKPLRYASYYDPYVSPCYNPFVG